MTKAELIQELRKRGVEKIWGRGLSRCLKNELELALRCLSEGQTMPYLSLTQVQMYLRCGLQYWFRYIEGKKVPPRGAAIVGRACHRALEHDFKTALKEGVHEPVDVLLDVYNEAFKAESEREVLWDRETPEEGFKSGRAVLERFATNGMETIVPVAVEEEVELPLFDGINLKVVIDLEDIAEGILDHKITTRKINAQDFAGDLQLRVYSYAKRQSRVGFNVLVRKKSPEIQLLRGKLQEADWNWALNILGYVAQGIQRQVFLPAPPGAWWCSPQWCGYWEECHRELSQ